MVELKKYCFLHRKILYLGTYLANTDSQLKQNIRNKTQIMYFEFVLVLKTNRLGRNI